MPNICILQTGTWTKIPGGINTIYTALQVRTHSPGPCFWQAPRAKTCGNPSNRVIWTRLIELATLITLPPKALPTAALSQAATLQLLIPWPLWPHIEQHRPTHPSQSPAEHIPSSACPAHLLPTHPSAHPPNKQQPHKHSQWQKHHASSTFLTPHLSMDVQQEKPLPSLFEELLTSPPLIHLDHKSASHEPLLLL